MLIIDHQKLGLYQSLWGKKWRRSLDCVSSYWTCLMPDGQGNHIGTIRIYPKGFESVGNQAVAFNNARYHLAFLIIVELLPFSFQSSSDPSSQNKTKQPIFRRRTTTTTTAKKTAGELAISAKTSLPFRSDPKGHFLHATIFLKMFSLMPSVH